VLFPEQGFGAWLVERRISLWQLLGERQQEPIKRFCTGVLKYIEMAPF
tara:strand:- start:436 stop:579 length:144 start_codon:yes stop_codon:yes gene_type:complete